LAAAPHPLLGRGSVHASLISGGEELSTYPSRCVVSLERRTLPGEDGTDVSALIEGVDASSRVLLVREPFAIDPSEEVVRLVQAAAGGAPLVGAPYWTDAAFIAAAGIPTVLYGPGGAGAHAAEEWVSLSETEEVVRVLVEVAAGLAA
jgi:acetylornithine deacetylase